MGCGNSHSFEPPPPIDNRPVNKPPPPQNPPQPKAKEITEPEHNNKVAESEPQSENEEAEPEPESDNDSAKQESEKSESDCDEIAPEPEEETSEHEPEDDSQQAAEPEESEQQIEPIVKMAAKKPVKIAKPVVTGSEAETAASRGRTDVEYPLVVNIVRIFTSSTFTDTKVERNSLMERVYPKLKEFCQERGYEFQVVDMRWGVRDEATDDHMTSELCMNEIEECQRLSTGPNFITFLAQKYGYRPFPPKIHAQEFEAMLKATENEDDKKLLLDWFLRDDNASPPHYLLQPIRDKLPDYINDAEPDKKKEARNTWWATFERLTLILRTSASKSLKDHEEVHKYYRAVTEEEIYRGILVPDNVTDTCYWFKREIHDVEEHLSDKTARRFIDMAGKELDSEAINLLSKLRDKDIPAKLPDNCVTNYKVKWSENGIEPAVSKEHEEYINSFCKDFESTLQGMITKGIAKRKEEMVKSSTHVEYVTHATFCQKRGDVFHGRNDVIEVIKNKLEKNTGKPLVITGGPGSGKTSLVAKVTTELRKWRGEDVTIIVRFLGTSSQSANTKDLLWSLCKQLADSIQDTQEIPEGYAQLVERFKELVKSASKSKTLCLVLDSLDQLKDQGRNLKEWIPQDVKSNVWVLLSTITAEGFTIEGSLKAFLPSSCFLPVPLLTSDDNQVILEEWFNSECRTLTSDQMELLEDACNECRLPLYTKIAFDQALRWKSFNPLDGCTLGNAVEGVITGLFDLVEKYHGKIITSQTLGYITAAKSGISNPELEDTLSIDDVALNDVFQYHQPPLRRLAPLIAARIQAEIREFLITSGSDGVQVIRWYHRQFQASAEKRYLSTEEQRKVIHTNLVEFFTGKWSNGVKKDFTDRKGNKGSADRYVAKQPLVFSEGDDGTIFNLRKMSELPYHLVQLQDLQGLKDNVFMNFDWLYNKIRGAGIGTVLDDYFMATQSSVTDDEIDAVGKCLKLAKRALRRDPRQLAIELWARLGKTDAKEQPNIARLLEAARNTSFNCLFTSQAFLTEADGGVVDRFTGHEENVAAYVVTKDRKTLVTCGSDQTFRFWEMSSGKEIRKAQLPEEVYVNGYYSVPFKFYLCNNEQAAVFGVETELIVFDLYKETIIHQLEIEGEQYDRNILVHVEGDNLYAVETKKIQTYKISTMEKGPTYKVPPPIEIEELLDTQPRDFLEGCHGKLVFHRACQTNAQVITLSTGKVQDIAITTKKVKEVAVRLALTSGGHLVSYQLTQKKDPVYECNGQMVVFDVNTGKQVKSVGGINHGHLLGFEILFPLTDKDVMWTTSVMAQQSLMAINTDSGKITKVMDTATNYMQNAIGLQDGRFLFTYITDGTIVECMNYHTLVSGQQDAAPDEEELKDDDALDIHKSLPGATRYQVYGTLSGKLSIWDLAARRCVRKALTYTSGIMTQWPTSRQSLGLGLTHGGGMTMSHLDWQVGKKLLESKVKVYKPVDQGTRVGFLDENHAVIQGPEPSDISVIDLKQDKITFTISRPKSIIQTMSGLLVSENKKVAILFRAEDPATEVKKDKDGNLDTTIYAFDLQAKKYRGETTMKVQSLVMAYGVTNHSAVLTPDGSSFITLTYLKAGRVLAVADIFDSKWRIVPKTFESALPSYVSYSTTLKAMIVLYDSGDIVTFDLKTFTKLSTMNTGVYARTVSFSHDSLLLAMNSSDRVAEMTMVDLKHMEVISKFTGHAEISAFAWSGDNCCLLLAIKGVKHPVQLYLHRPSGGGNGKYKSEQEYLQHLQGQKDIFGKPKEVSFIEA